MPVDDSRCLHRNNHRFVCERAVPGFVTQVGQASFAIHTSQRFFVWGEPIVSRCLGIQGSRCFGRKVELLAVVKEDGGRVLGDVDGHTSDRADRLVSRSQRWLGECCTQQLQQNEEIEQHVYVQREVQIALFCREEFRGISRYFFASLVPTSPHLSPQGRSQHSKDGTLPPKTVSINW